jgi:hypothetical protein
MRKTQEKNASTEAMTEEANKQNTAHTLSMMPTCDNVGTKKTGCEGVNDDDIINLNIIHITSTEGGREVNLCIL